MFNNCHELETIDLSGFDTSSAIDMECMFNGCNKLKKIISIEKFNTSKVTTIGTMFQQCNELESK